MRGKVFIFRHGEKENIGSQNPPLSARGQKQAQNLVQMVLDKKLPAPNMLLASPSMRTRQTFFHLSETLKVSITDKPELIERKNSENAEQFSKRVQLTLNWISSQNTFPVFLVTHFDWIEEAMTFIPSDTDLNQDSYRSWRPLQFMGFEIEDGIWKMIQQGHVEGQI
jgi:phosphohistidine phosphatase SixA